MIESQIDKILADVKSNRYTTTDAKYLLKELFWFCTKEEELMIENQIEKILADVKSNRYTTADAEYLLKELEKSCSSLEKAKKEVVLSNIAKALQVIKSLT